MRKDAPVRSTSAPETHLDPAEVRGILAKTDLALLLNCLVQLTGDAGLLDRYGQGTVQRPNPTRRLMPDSHMPADSAAAVVSRLAELLTSQGRGAAPVITVPDRDLFQRMTELAVGVPAAAARAGRLPAGPAGHPGYAQAP
jgi:hypothetical protein